MPPTPQGRAEQRSAPNSAGPNRTGEEKLEHIGRGRPGRWIIRLFAAIGLAGVLTVAAPLPLWLMPQPSGTFRPPEGETLVVLGSGSVDDFPDLDTYWRCVYALRFYRSGSFRTIILSGGAPHGESVASVMASFLRSEGVPQEKLVLEEKSRSTRENATEVARLLPTLPAGRVVLLTSDYHTRRASAAFRRAGVDVQTIIVPYVIKLNAQRWMRPMLLREVLLERAKLLWYWYRGWI